MDVSISSCFFSFAYLFCEQTHHCENKCNHTKTTLFRKKFSAPLFKSFIFFTLVILIILPEEAFAKKSKTQSKWKGNCNFRTTKWEECSKPCDMGVSFRVITTPKCKPKREIRLCIDRHCDEARFKPPIKGKSRCLKIFRSKEKEFLKYAGSVSEKGYKMRYCGVCEDANKCCTPTKTKTRKVRFRSKDGKRFVKQVAFIRKCKCHRKCKSSRGVFSLPLYDDIEREDGTISVQKQMNAIAGTRPKKSNRKT